MLIAQNSSYFFHILGVTVSPNMDVFLENFQTALTPPPSLFGNYIADFVGFKAVYFGRKLWKKGPKRGGKGGSSPIQKISLQIYAHLTDFLGKSAM